MALPELAAIDLNLLVALDALLAERHVTRAARRARTSQPAMSRALARLRDLFCDPLLVRVGGELRPTPRAQTLVEPLGTALATVRSLVRAPAFDPARARGICRVAASDDVTLLFAARLHRRMRAAAPGIDLVFLPWSADWYRSLCSGDVTLTFGVPRGDEPNVRAREVLRDRWVCVLREGHPALRGPWTPSRFAALEHALFTVQGDGPGQVDHALAASGLRRRVAMRVAWAAQVPMIVADTDLVCTTSWQVATELARRHPIVLRDPPVSLPPLRFPMLWHERDHGDPRHAWLRQQLVAVGLELPRPRLRSRRRVASR